MSKKESLKKRAERTLQQCQYLRLKPRYQLTNEILGIGSFGVVMKCKVEHSPDRCVAKIVNTNVSSKKVLRMLDEERKTLQYLHECRPLKPFLIKIYAQITFENRDQEECVALILEDAGRDLEKILEVREEYAFSKAQTLKIGREVTKALQALHNYRMVHRDIKPSNIVLRLHHDEFQIRLIDFGLAQKWTPAHRPPPSHRGAGTPNFSAFRQQMGYPGSPARDMEALIYTMVYLVGHPLPWHKFKHQDRKVQNRQMAKCKRETNATFLCGVLDGGTEVLGKLLEKVQRCTYGELPPYDDFFLFFEETLETCPKIKNPRKRKFQKSQISPLKTTSSP